MVKADLIPSDKQIKDEAEAFKVHPVDTQSPYKANRPLPSIYEKPEILSRRIDKFRNKISLNTTLNE